MRVLLLLVSIITISLPVNADTLLIKNARIFDGVNPSLTAGHVYIENGLISGVTKQLPKVQFDTIVIDANNRILTPGFIDIHTHLGEQYAFKYDKYHPTVHGVFAGKATEFYLSHGFTAIRDAGGTSPDIARIINDGAVQGPRFFSSGAYIGQTSGHGDFRLPSEVNPILNGQSPYINHGASVLADGVDQVLTATRENLKQGATQIKIMGGGGVVSSYDPIHSIQYTPAEIRAAVQAAADWGTYVMAHAYTSDSMKRLIENGVKSIEHGLLIDDATAKLAAENDVVISTQVFIFSDDDTDTEGYSEDMLAKNRLVKAGQQNLIKLIKKYKIKTGFGTDLIFGNYPSLGKEFSARAKYWMPYEILRQVTSESAEIIRMAGPLIKGPKFGQIKQGWAADVLLLNGEPQTDITILEDLESTVALVIKAGDIVANRLDK